MRKSTRKPRERGVLHITFEDNAARNLRKALPRSRANDRVVHFPDDLSFGPIDPPDPLLRAAWAKHEILFASGDGRALARATRSFWRRCASPRKRCVVWLARSSAREYCGFLEFVWRWGDAPYEIVDLTGLSITHPNGDQPRLILAIGQLSESRIRENAFWDRAAPFPPEARETCRDLWRKLRTENAALRIIGETRLVSAPLTFFDDLILAQLDSRWHKTAYIVGQVLDATFERGYDVGIPVIRGRLRTLAAAGRMESAGNLAKMGYSEVRLPSSEGARPSPGGGP